MQKHPLMLEWIVLHWYFIRMDCFALDGCFHPAVPMDVFAQWMFLHPNGCSRQQCLPMDVFPRRSQWMFFGNACFCTRNGFFCAMDVFVQWIFLCNGWVFTRMDVFYSSVCQRVRSFGSTSTLAASTSTSTYSKARRKRPPTCSGPATPYWVHGKECFNFAKQSNLNNKTDKGV